jgi:hypothetical protein
MSHKLLIDDCHKLAELKGGKFLSNEYTSSDEKYKWKCNDEHEWMASYHNVKKGSWCPDCAGKSKQTIEECHRLAEKQDGKCLSIQYVNNKKNLHWKCNQGHEWYSNFSNVKRGRWCNACRKKTIQDCQKIAETKGGKCLSVEYINKREKLKWECHLKHTWNASYNQIKNNQWCPECADRTKGEKLVRYCFEKMLKCDFKKVKPNWMINPKTGWKLELDGYNENMSVAFEHQGIHHEKDCPINHKLYKPDQWMRDDIKRQKCKERGITLIEVPEIGTRLKLKDVVPFLLSEFDKHNIAYPERAKSFQIDMKEFYAEYMNEKSTTGVDDFLSELDAMDFSDASLFEDLIVDEVNNLDFDDPALFN